MARDPAEPRGRSKLWNLVLFVPFVALLWVPFYNSVEPTIWGVPFFYWYQFAWVFITAGLTIWVLRVGSDR